MPSVGLVLVVVPLAVPLDVAELFVLLFSVVFGGGTSGEPPSSGEMWFRETCSMNDVPYFLKYHHSNI